MKKTLRLYFGILLISLTFTSLAFAGNIQCPLDDPPPPEDGRGIPTNTNTDQMAVSSYQILNECGKLIQNIELF